ncbi:Desert hedgehog protein B [Symbiodinium microadriaticum]|uniref:Desert hedgehog protein B n=1 Tax=Symbiodinium microadriaticum TaxID=2951 RepID=A0A1Q9DV26_SYMMI|nr:Desert hedgehog protein B [Symbiodinium microadriaticum]
MYKSTWGLSSIYEDIMEKVNEVELENDIFPRSDSFVFFLLKKVLPDLSPTTLKSKWNQMASLFKNLTQGHFGMFIRTAIERTELFSAKSIAAAPMVGDAASSLAGSLGDAANSLGDSASDGNCFPATATVFERHRGIIHMASVRFSDCGAGDFSEVIAFLHFDPGATMNCISVVHETGALVLSSDHLISMRRGTTMSQKERKYVAFVDKQSLGSRRGDLLQDAGGHPSAVLRVRKCCAKGRFAPLTDRGTLVVGGAHCSCFAPPQAFHFGHSLCHAAVAPLRAVAVLRRSGFCVEEVFAAAALLFSENCDRTLHPFCAALLRAARWYDGSVRKVRDSEASANEHFL